MKFPATLLACMAFTSALHAQPSHNVKGILESSGDHSAVLAISPGSGDLIGYAFPNQSPVGRKILGLCLTGMPCALEGLVESSISDKKAAQLSFAGRDPVAWLGIRSVRNASIGIGLEDPVARVQTRHGIVEADRDQLLLRYRGKPLLPQDSGSYSIVRHVQMGAEDVLLVQNDGGTACPALFRFVTVSAKGASVSEEFGSCSDLAYAFVAEGPPGQPEHMVVRMPGFKGPFESEQEQLRAARTRMEWTYANRRLTRVGKAEAASRK